jgi:hypothetical protein
MRLVLVFVAWFVTSRACATLRRYGRSRPFDKYVCGYFESIRLAFIFLENVSVYFPQKIGIYITFRSFPFPFPFFEETFAPTPESESSTVSGSSSYIIKEILAII